LLTQKKKLFSLLQQRSGPIELEETKFRIHWRKKKQKTKGHSPPTSARWNQHTSAPELNRSKQKDTTSNSIIVLGWEKTQHNTALMSPKIPLHNNFYQNFFY